MFDVSQFLDGGPLADSGRTAFAVPQAKAVGAGLIVRAGQSGVACGGLCPRHQVRPDVDAVAADLAPFFQQGRVQVGRWHDVVDEALAEPGPDVAMILLVVGGACIVPA